jgi:hypothetical protein
MALEITGTLIKILPEQTGAGKNGNWVKQEFIIETAEQYPKKVCCSAWGDKVASLKAIPTGTQIKVSINLESREYNERWYTDIRAWKIDVVSAGGSKEEIPGNIIPEGIDTFHSGEEDSLPF